jgi:hypothetical protein
MAPLLFLAAVTLPIIDLPSNCRAEASAIPPDPQHKSVYESCMTDEQAAHEALLKRWTLLPAAVRETCAEMGRIVGSYIEVEACVDTATSNAAGASPPVRPGVPKP